MNDVLQRAAALKQLVDKGAEAPSDRPIAEAIVGCCQDLLDAGESRMALALADSAQGLAQNAPADWALRVGILRVEALTGSGELDKALALWDRLSKEHKEGLARPTNDSYRLRICEAHVLWLSSRADEAVSRLREIRSELLARPDSILLASCSNHISAAETVRGNYEGAREFAWEAIVSARRCGAPSIEGRALMNLGLLERQRCRWSNAEEAARKALGLFERGGNRVQACHARRSAGTTEWKRGNLEVALALAQTSLDQATVLGNGLLEWYGCLLKGMVLMHAGEFVASRDLFSSPISLESAEMNSRPSLLTTEFLGDIHLEQGEAEAALRHYDEVWPKALAIVPKGDIVAELRRRRAECYLLLGRLDEAYAEAKTGLEHCRELGDRYEEAATYRVLALAAAALGRPAEAKQHFTQGFAYYDDIETPYEWGKLWMSYGDWLGGPLAGEFADPRGALEAHHAARDHFERMGARAKLAEASARIGAHAAELQPSAVPVTVERRRAPRRPRSSAELERRAHWAYESFGVVTRNDHLLRLLEDVAKLAKSDASILVLGESGTGKELVAGGIHRLSARSGAYIPLNCSALPREVIENELFGHVAGGFTGALRDKPGLFELCDGGTIFLDEIAEMSLELQSKLLRVLESGEVRRIGSGKNVTVSTRVVAATNRERAALERGEGVRKDLYYRLAHAVVELPALRHRGDDVGILVDHFLAETCAQERRRVSLTDAGWERLTTHGWPGNVREMKAAIRRRVLLAPEGHAITAEELELGDASVATTLLEEIEVTERRRVIEALSQTRGSRTEAAKLLGLPRTTLLNKMKRFGLR